MATLPNSVFLNRATPPSTFTLMIIAAMSALPLNMLLASLPAMAAEFGVTYNAMSLAITLYLALTAFIQIIIGPLSDLYGRRPVLLGAFAIALIASIGTSYAQSYMGFMLFRCVQGAAITGSVLSRAIVRDMVAREDAASKLGYVTMGMAVVPMLSIPLGGMLDAAFGWRAVFHFQSTMLLFAFLLAAMDQGETIRQRPDSFGAQFREYPSLLRSLRFWCYVAILALTVSLYFTFIANAPNIAAQVYGLLSDRFAFYITVTPLGYFVGNFISGRFSQRVGVQSMLLIGGGWSILAFVSAYILIAQFPDQPACFFMASFALALGNGIVIPNAIAALLEVNPKLSGAASGLSGAAMTLGAALMGILASLTIMDHSRANSLIVFLLLVVMVQMAFTIWVGRIERARRGHSV